MLAAFSQCRGLSGQREGGVGWREDIAVGRPAQGGERTQDPSVMLDPNPCPWATAGLSDLLLLNLKPFTLGIKETTQEDWGSAIFRVLGYVLEVSNLVYRVAL